MRTTIDDAGRVVIPKELRTRAGLSGGQEVEINERDGTIEIEPAPTPMRLKRTRGGVVVAVPDRELPPLTDEIVRATLDRVRR
jgi:AbrB family looped-hinge helix DNA binding protein